MSTHPQTTIPPSPRSQSDAAGAAMRVDVVDSADLIANGKLVYIQHRGEIYTLRQTRLGKLILTK
jgi:hemin uptake protein HemP